MKGLLLKDYYMLKTVGRTSVLIAGLMMICALFSAQTMFFLNFAVLFTSLIPLSFLSMDEKDKWTEYTKVLYSKKDIVTSTYVFGLILIASAALLGVCVFCLKNLLCPMVLNIHTIQYVLLILLAVGLMPFVLVYPIVFWLGTEKGRFVYMGLMGLLYALFLTLSQNAAIEAMLQFDLPSVGILAVSYIVLYAASWSLSIFLYGKRLQK